MGTPTSPRLDAGMDFSAGYGFATFRTWEPSYFVHDGGIAHDGIDGVFGSLDSDLGRVSSGSRSGSCSLIEVRNSFSCGNFRRRMWSIGRSFRFLLSFDGMLKALHELRVLFADGSF